MVGMATVGITQDNLTLVVSDNTTAVLNLWASRCGPFSGSKTQTDVTVGKAYPQARHARAAQCKEAMR